MATIESLNHSVCDCKHYVVGRDEAVIRDDIKKQEREDTRLDQLGPWK